MNEYSFTVTTSKFGTAFATFYTSKDINPIQVGDNPHYIAQNMMLANFRLRSVAPANPQVDATKRPEPFNIAPVAQSELACLMLSEMIEQLDVRIAIMEESNSQVKASLANYEIKFAHLNRHDPKNWPTLMPITNLENARHRKHELCPLYNQRDCLAWAISHLDKQI
jgi:hypothetical protein